MDPSSSQENENGGIPREVEDDGLPSPTTPAKRVQQAATGDMVVGSSPSRKVIEETVTVSVHRLMPVFVGKESRQLCRVGRRRGRRGRFRSNYSKCQEEDEAKAKGGRRG